MDGMEITQFTYFQQVILSLFRQKVYNSFRILIFAQQTSFKNFICLLVTNDLEELVFFAFLFDPFSIFEHIQPLARSLTFNFSGWKYSVDASLS